MIGARPKGRGWLVALWVAVWLAVLVVVENVLVASSMRHLPRLATDFSPTYLDREIGRLAGEPPRTIFLGDSVLWGYGLPVEDTAIRHLAAGGLREENLAFKTANPATDFFLLRLLFERGVRPRAVVLEINGAVFNPFDQSYRALHPGLLALARPLVSPDDAARLRLDPPAARADLERLAANAWLPYGMRTDVRETLFEPIPTPPPHLGAEQFAMTYDQAPLRKKNVELHYLRATAELLAHEHVAALAFLTPVNHVLLHEYVDNPQYRANLARLTEVLRSAGIATLDFDAALPGDDFFDNDHLNRNGQRDLERLLRAALAKEGVR